MALNTTPVSGFRADGFNEVALGPGAVYLNYGITGTGPGTQRLFGLTRGGNSFNPGVSFRDIDFDKPFTGIKGLRVIDDVIPTITSNVMQLGTENLQRMLPGLVEIPYVAVTGEPAPTHTIWRLRQLQDADYIQNVAIVGSVLGGNVPFIGIIYNALAGGELEISLENKSESVVGVTFTGYFSAIDLEALALGSKTLEEVVPFAIRWPKPPAPTA